MANPTMPVLADAAAEALSGVVDVSSGIKHQVFDQDEFDTPSAFANLMNLEANMMQLIAGSNQGRVVDLKAGLTVGVFSMLYRIGATAYAYPGDATTTLSANATTYVYLDTAATLKTSETGWPSGDHVKLAIVTTDATDVTDVSDRRFENFQIGIVNDWASVVASGTVDFGGNGIKGLGGLAGQDWVALTIAAGSVTPTQMFHTIDSEGGGAFDDLDTITATAGERKILILKQADIFHQIAIKHGTGNIFLADNIDLQLNNVADFVVLIQETDTIWRELTRSKELGSRLTSLDVNSQALLNVGGTNLYSIFRNISAGAVTVLNTLEPIRTEGNVATDDLDTINYTNVANGQILILVGDMVSQTITVKHNTGNIKLVGGLDFDLKAFDRSLILRWDSNNAVWYEILRTPLSIPDLKDSGDAIPYPLVHFEGGALSVGVLKAQIYCAESFTIKDVTGVLGTGPTGGACIVDIREDGLSIFASQAEMVNIADATTQDTSAVKNHVVAAGSIMTIEVEAATGSPADLTVSINGFIAPKSAAV